MTLSIKTDLSSIEIKDEYVRLESHRDEANNHINMLYRDAIRYIFDRDIKYRNGGADGLLQASDGGKNITAIATPKTPLTKIDKGPFVYFKAEDNLSGPYDGANDKNVEVPKPDNDTAAKDKTDKDKNNDDDNWDYIFYIVRGNAMFDEKDIIDQWSYYLGFPSEGDLEMGIAEAKVLAAREKYNDKNINLVKEHGGHREVVRVDDDKN